MLGCRLWPFWVEEEVDEEEEVQVVMLVEEPRLVCP